MRYVEMTNGVPTRQRKKLSVFMKWAQRLMLDLMMLEECRNVIDRPKNMMAEMGLTQTPMGAIEGNAHILYREGLAKACLESLNKAEFIKFEEQFKTYQDKYLFGGHTELTPDEEDKFGGRTNEGVDFQNIQWEFTGEKKLFRGHTVRRIRLSVDCGVGKKGDIGGWIEGIKNLTENGWVEDEAVVYENAVVRDCAKVTCEAVIFGNAVISGEAIVYGKATVGNDAVVSESATIGENAVICGNAVIGGRTMVTGMVVVGGGVNLFRDTTIDGHGEIGMNYSLYKPKMPYSMRLDPHAPFPLT